MQDFLSFLIVLFEFVQCGDEIFIGEVNLADKLNFLDILVGGDFDLSLKFGDLFEDLLFEKV